MYWDFFFIFPVSYLPKPLDYHSDVRGSPVVAPFLKIWYGCFDFLLFFLHYSKKCCNFAAESSTPGFRGWEMSPLGKPTRLTKYPSRGFQDILKRRLLTLCSDGSKSRKFQLCSGLSNGRCPTGYRLSSLCLLVLVHLLRIYVCAHAYLN